MRRALFEDTLRLIERENANPNNTFKLAVNKFADWSPQEFKSIHKYKHAHHVGTAPPVTGKRQASLPRSVDWRVEGAVNEIQNQGYCGSCYAFSSAAAMESRWYLKSGELLKLSEQQIVDCSWIYGNGRCNGG